MKRREGPPHCLKNLETPKQAVSWPKMASGSLCGACQPVNILGVAGFMPLHPLPVYEESATGWRWGEGPLLLRGLFSPRHVVRASQGCSMLRSGTVFTLREQQVLTSWPLGYAPGEVPDHCAARPLSLGSGLPADSGQT